MVVVHGNRGKCAQPCRKYYTLLKSGNKVDSGYLLSTRDLCGLDFIPQLIKSGVTCFKIEGRLKNADYVSTVTRIYRKYIDLAYSEKEYIVDESDRIALLQVFNRGGFSSGYLNNTPNRNLIYKEKPNNMGLPLGKILNFNPTRGYITLKLENEVEIGDSISVGKEQGLYNVSELMQKKANIREAHKGLTVTIGRAKGNISVGDTVYKIVSKKLSTLSNNFVTTEYRKVPILCKVSVRLGTPVTMTIWSSSSSEPYCNTSVTVVSNIMPEKATNAPISAKRICEQVDKLGGTHYSFSSIEIDMPDEVYIPSISGLNKLRRDCIEAFTSEVITKIHRECPPTFNSLKFESTPNNISANMQYKTSILLNSLNADYDYTLLKNVDKVYIPLSLFMEPKYATALSQITSNYNTYIYMPTILKDAMLNVALSAIENILSTNNIQGFVISNISQIYILNKYASTYTLIGNYTMNVYNYRTTEELKELGITAVTVSPELDIDRLNLLATQIHYQGLDSEAIVYGSLPVITTNYCLLSRSNSCLKNCNSNCTSSKYSYSLRDKTNASFTVIPDSFFGTTTILNSRKLSINPTLVHTDFIRFNFENESIDQINSTLEYYISGKYYKGTEFTSRKF